MTQTIKADLCIIGAGSGGLSVAAGAAQLGKKVVLIEKGKMGGDCLNYGCVPSKALLAAAKQAHTMRSGSAFGIAPAKPDVDFQAVHDHVHKVIAEIEPHDSQERFEGLGVTVLRDAARFTGPQEVVAGKTTVQAKFFVVATGSSPFVPPINGIDDVPYITNETLFDRTDLPGHLIVVGGGPIGLEMAQAHRRLGAEVTVIEAASILPKDDPELVEIVRQRLIAEGITLHEGAKVTAVRGSDGDITAHLEGTGVPDMAQGTHLLIAAGRRANVTGLDLEKADIQHTPGGITVDDKLRTSNKRIFAIGDVAGGLQFTHVAGYHASVVIQNMLFKLVPKKNQETLSPWVTYVDPELAHIGLTEAQAKERNLDHSIVRWEFEENDRAKAEHATTGLIKVVLGKGGRILGASIVGKNAGDLIGPWALALANNLKIKAFTNMIAPYPTLGEVSKRAASAYFSPSLFSDRTRRLIRLLSIFD